MPLIKVDITREDTAFPQYTDGTTSVAKDVAFSRGNICANTLQAKERIRNQLRESKEIVITVLPLYHIFTLTVNLMIFTNTDFKIILIINPHDVKGFTGELKEECINVFVGVNTLFNGMVSQLDFATVDFSDLRPTLGGSMTAQKAVAEKRKDITGTPIVGTYGPTEANPGVCRNPLNIETYSDGIGLPIPPIEIELRDANGNAVV